MFGSSVKNKIITVSYRCHSNEDVKVRNPKLHFIGFSNMKIIIIIIQPPTSVKETWFV